MPRIARHLSLFAASALTCYAFYAVHASPDALWRLSMGSAYASLALIALSLAIGPWNRLRKRPNPVSSYLRRDVGIWAGIVGIFHVIVGLQVHFKGKMWLYFVPEPGARFPLRIDPFGLANWVGVLATAVLLMLLFLSNDASLRALGRDRWKSLQRWNYAGALLVIGHGLLYILVEKRVWPWVAVTLAIALPAAAMQLAGYRAAKKRG